MTTPIYRITIEGPPDGRERLTSLVAAQLQVLGCKAIHLIRNDAGNSAVKADAVIVAKALMTGKADPLSQALNEGDGVYRP